MNIDNGETEVSGILLVLWKEKHEPQLGHRYPKDSPFGQDLSRGAQDTTCDQMDESNSTSQHFDPVSKFSVYNLNPPEIIGVSRPILPCKSRKKYKESKMTLENACQEGEMATLSDATMLQRSKTKWASMDKVGKGTQQHPKWYTFLSTHYHNQEK